MKLPDPADVLRHRGRALLVGSIEGWDGETLRCTSRRSGPWHWPEMLEGAAQAAGLLAGMRAGGISNRAVIAEYRDVRIHAAAYHGPIRFAVSLERRLLHFWRCRVEAHGTDGGLLLDGAVTLAPGS